ncbi:MAG: response regulator transcription factor [Proteobacteria bacterium]|nr:response regulator transcription factor [Pseudomonadota bacterium]
MDQALTTIGRLAHAGARALGYAVMPLPHAKESRLNDALDGFAVLLVDDHPLFRDGLATALRHKAPGMRVRAVGTLPEAVEVLAQAGEGFDLVLLDYRLPDTDGLRCAAQLREQFPDVSIGLMSGLDDPSLPRRTRDAGLVAYLPKTLEVSALLASLNRLAAGEPVFDLPAVVAVSEPVAGPYGLTGRQLDVLRELATGASNKEIARALGIAPATVKNHVEAIFTKMGTSNRLQAVVLARATLQGTDG